MRTPVINEKIGEANTTTNPNDEKIANQVVERIKQNTQANLEEITVYVNDGWVTLKGTVPDYFLRHTIQDVAFLTPGVKNVNNELMTQSA